MAPKRVRERIQFSLKYKLVILLISLSTLVLMALVFFASRIFENDKIAYVFDSAAMVSKTLAGQLHSDSRLHLPAATSVLEESHRLYQSQKNPEARIVRVLKRQVGRNGVRSAVLWERAQGQTARVLAQVSQSALNPPVLKVDLEVACRQGADILPRSSNEVLMVYCAMQSGRALAVGFQVDAGATGHLFGSKGIYRSFVTDAQGRVLFGQPPIDEAKVPAWTALREVVTGSAVAGTREFTPPGGVALLVSFAQVGIRDLSVISWVDRDIALHATRFLRAKMAWFFALLVFGSLLISVLASRRLTATLMDLVAASLEIASGRFEVKVDARSGDEVGLLAGTFNRMSAEVLRLLTELRQANAELENYSKNLEKMVAERTAEIREKNRLLDAILNSLGQGFLIVSKDGRCAPVYSKACVQLLGGSPAGRPITEVLKVKPAERDTFDAWLGNLFEEPIPFESLIELGMSELSEGDRRCITLEYFAMRQSAQGAIEGVVVVATDRTEERAAMRRAETEHAESARILKLVRNRHTFLRFSREAKSMISALPTVSGDLLLRYLHTLKGGAQSFGITQLAELAHRCEDLAIEKGGLLPDSLKEQGRLREALEAYWADNQIFLGSGSDPLESRLEVSEQALRGFLDELKAAGQPAELRRKFALAFLQTPIENELSEYRDVVQDAAAALGKKVAPLQIEANGVRIVAHPYSGLFQTFVHFFKNAVDHGIESPEDRIELGKPESGTIRVQINVDSRTLAIDIEDDGRGVDPRKIRERMAEKFPDKKIDRESDEDVIQHLFDPGFSTAEKVTVFSGRGAGLDAVRAAARALDGDVRVYSRAGQGTRFTVKVPLIQDFF